MWYKRNRRFNRRMKMIALMQIIILAVQILKPTISFGLTTGPSQPEVQSFEPVGTTDMVDMSSGSFVYNIPLMDVEGYPVNISYHGGVTMEQEASWVGLGWNINPGAINRSVRGIPDDFNGDKIAKELNIKPEKTTRVGLGISGEAFGLGDPLLDISLSLGGNLNISNYRGVSCDFDLGCGINFMKSVSAGVNIGVGSQSGASVDYNVGVSASSQTLSKEATGSLGVTVGGGYNTRSGLKDVNVSTDISAQLGKFSAGYNSTANIPIGLKNYVPVITNSSTMNSISGRIKLGPEVTGLLGYVNVNANVSKLTFHNDATRSSYGYMYLQNANLDNSSILDFTRDKDGSFNKSMAYLPTPNMTYDIYNVSGQGTGGMFRPFRNDFGNVYDPVTNSTSESDGGEMEYGAGDLFEVGLDYTHAGTDITSGPWGAYQRSGTPDKGFTSTSNGSVYENVYFKQGGELTAVNASYYSAIGGVIPMTPDQAMKLPQTKPGSATQRDARANLIYYKTASQASISGIGTNADLLSYTDTAFTTYANQTTVSIPRVTTNPLGRKKDQISEITQLQKDGKRYIYGLPAMNNVQREITFSVDTTKDSNHVDLNDGMVQYASSDISMGNSNGRDNYYSSTVTPAYAHSYLLTSVLSPDYVDVTGDGPTDDDLGSFTKFNYTRTESDFRWRTPTYADSAQYSPGFWSDPKDDKANIVCGSREQWTLHSIETKNFISEFYTSRRKDGQDIRKAIVGSGAGDYSETPYNTDKTTTGQSYRLDSIKLYNKHDRFINGAAAIPIKTVFFVYDYSLCQGIPNTSGSGGDAGKLTLKGIYFRYGTSSKSTVSPYQFGYSSFNPNYSLISKDRWGDYKPNSTSFTNYEFPYVNQTDTADNTYASAWSLNSITLPSGGVIQASYESNDYAYVQDRAANEMFIVNGIGNTPDFNSSGILYADAYNPNLYTYFTRKLANEAPGLTCRQNYLDTQKLVYFNFNVRLTNKSNSYEQIKGYATVDDMGYCSDGIHGYVKFRSKRPTGGGSLVNPVSYTAVNEGRYNIPQIIYPGNDGDESDLANVLMGLKGSFNELLNIGHSPVDYLITKLNGAQEANVNKSYIRLQSVGLCKKGGGQRVRSLQFFDNWTKLAGGNEYTATYGKNYDYTLPDGNYTKISSGVASYEPMIGGDENPLRQPIPYTAQSGSDFPSNDPVELYQETPIGESLFPSAQIVYSQVKITSINASKARSAQGVDIYQFYTAKDYPAQVIATGLDSRNPNHYDFFSQKNLMWAKQGYTLIFNDMHGKPKKVEHDVMDPVSQTLQPINWQLFNYKHVGSKLDNTVKCLAYNTNGYMTLQSQQLGVEEDVTLDSRQKDEDTKNHTVNGNLNFFMIGIFPCPIPLGFTWGSESENEFQSAVVAKVVQQYGILDYVQSYNEGATTTMQNEIYDPNTGDVLVTSINNEYKDKEYTTNIPAYWGYKGMGPAYANIGYKDTGTITVGTNRSGQLNIINSTPLDQGDELHISYNFAGARVNTRAWVMGPSLEYCYPFYNYSNGGDSGRAYKLPQSTYPSGFLWDTSNMTYAKFNSEMMGDTILTTAIHGFWGGLLNGFPHDTCVYVDSFSLFSNYGSPTAGVSLAGGGAVPVTSKSLYPVYFSIAKSGTDFTVIGSCFMQIYIDKYPALTDTNKTAYFTSGNVTGRIVAVGTTLLGRYFTLYVTFPYEVYKTGYLKSSSSGTFSNSSNTFQGNLFEANIIHFAPPSPSCSGPSVLPEFPLNTTGWSDGNVLTGVNIKVINSGEKNLLNENVESYTGMDYPTDKTTNRLITSLSDLISLKAETYSDSNTRILHDYIINPDTINPYAIGERGIWRLQNEYAYLSDRNYQNVSARNSGLFSATGYYAPSVLFPVLGCSRFPYNFLEINPVDPAWHLARSITKWSPNGKEIENLDAVGNYSTAVYGYNEELPTAVASNARQGEILSDAFEDYQLLQPKDGILTRIYSPLNQFITTELSVTSPLYKIYQLTNAGHLSASSSVAHTGLYSLSVPGGTVYPVSLPLNNYDYSTSVNNYNSYYKFVPGISTSHYQFSAQNEYLPFEITTGKKYVVSYWLQQSSAAANLTDYPVVPGCGVNVGSTFYPMVKKSNIIDGWQQVEATITVPSSATSVTLQLPGGYYIDDMRVFPEQGNMKSFVYNPTNEKLMATLDENNFATIYEYDQEGNLVRTKKETAKGIMTISESRSGNPKQNR